MHLTNIKATAIAAAISLSLAAPSAAIAYDTAVASGMLQQGASDQGAETAGGDEYPNRCELYSEREKTPIASLSCWYLQRQDMIYIDLSNGASFALKPVDDMPGEYINTANNNKVYRKPGLGKQGATFQFPMESIYIYY
ncbi:MAG: hypothetical protein U9Q81_18405 [Pseudomonadota bacterium]|nr:hypothetical protein [Pseudomonadota bacterium]